MQYFSEEYLKFFASLSLNNYRGWFQDHKDEYDQYVNKPFLQFTTDLIKNVQEKYNPDLHIEPKKAIYRINRDIRFSKNKEPYKLHKAAVIVNEAKNNPNEAGMFLHFGLDEVLIGGGLYDVSTDHLMKIRTALMLEPQKLPSLITGDFKSVFGNLEGDENKRLKPPFAKAAEENKWLFKKQFFYMAKYDAEIIFEEKDIMDFVLKHYEAAMPMNAYLTECLK